MPVDTERDVGRGVLGELVEVVCYDSPGKRAVTLMVQAFLEKGLKRHGDRVAFYGGLKSLESAAAVAIIGISNEARDVVKQCRKAGKSFFVIDKGYMRRKSRGDIEHNAYWRVGVNALHTEFSTGQTLPPDRWERLDVCPGKIREPGEGNYVLVICSSIRLCSFLGLIPSVGQAGAVAFEQYFNHVIRQVLAATPLPVRLRNKVSSVSISGGMFAKQRNDRVSVCPPVNTMEEDLCGAAVAVEHSTNAGVYAILAGVPIVELGEGVVKPLAETDLSKVATPKHYTEEERARFLAWLAWQQWTMAEMASGEMWDYVKGRLSC